MNIHTLCLMFCVCHSPPCVPGRLGRTFLEELLGRVLLIQAMDLLADPDTVNLLFLLLLSRDPSPWPPHKPEPEVLMLKNFASVNSHPRNSVCFFLVLITCTYLEHISCINQEPTVYHSLYSASISSIFSVFSLLGTEEQPVLCVEGPEPPVPVPHLPEGGRSHQCPAVLSCCWLVTLMFFHILYDFLTFFPVASISLFIFSIFLFAFFVLLCFLFLLLLGLLFFSNTSLQLSPTEDFNRHILDPDLTAEQLEQLHHDALELYHTYMVASALDHIKFPTHIVAHIRESKSRHTPHNTSLVSCPPLSFWRYLRVIFSYSCVCVCFSRTRGGEGHSEATHHKATFPSL